MSGVRDSQVSKVYKSDHSLDKLSKRYETIPEIEQFLKDIWQIKKLHSLYPFAFKREPPRIDDGRGTSWARGGTNRLNLPKWARGSGTILHELSHCISDREEWWRKEKRAPHGWEFCSIYLDLTLIVMGKEAYNALKNAFKQNRVRYKKPFKRVLTQEQRQILVDRVTKAREAKRK